MAIFSDLIEKSMEVIIDDFYVFGETFQSCLVNLEQILDRCKEANLVLNWERCHFMVQEGIVPGHKISRKGIEVDKEKIDVIEKLPPCISERNKEFPWLCWVLQKIHQRLFQNFKAFMAIAGA